MNNNINPPKWPLKLVRFFLRKEYLEEIEGDMEEIFSDNIEKFSVRKARRMYTLDILRLLRPILLKNFEVIQHLNPYPMFRNYSKTSVRNLMKNPLTSFINIFGLAVAVGICLVVYTFLDLDYSIDRFHKNKDEVYLVTYFGNIDGAVQQSGLTPRPLGEMLKEDFTHIKKICRVEDGDVVMKYNDNVFHERVRYADPEFLEMFTFPLKWGTANSLTDINSIILSEDMSIKYFGTENPIGKDVLIKFSEDESKAFKVTGVAQAFPKAHVIDFNFLINFENLRIANPNYDAHDWSKFLHATLIQVDNSEYLKHIEKGMDKYRLLQNEAQHDWAISSFAFEPLETLHERSGLIRDDISGDDNREGRIGMPIIAIFMLALACFNYINIAIVSAAKRLKEIGVRKVIGANRSRIIIQFLSENIVVTFFALIFGFMLGYFIFIPWFVQFSGWNLEVKIFDKNLWIFLTSLLLFTGIASGIYPAFYISQFEVVNILKGSVQFGKKNPLTKIFLGIQLILACITITAAVVFTQNNDFQHNQSWGYNQKQALFTDVPDRAAFEKLNAIMIQDPHVLSASGSKDHLGKSSSKAIIHLPNNQQYEVNQLSVDANYFKTMGLQVKEGRVFKEHSENDKQSVVVNGQFVINLKLMKPIGSSFEIDSIRYEIVGVLTDFHINDFFHKIEPSIFTMANEDDYRYLSMSVLPGSEKETNMKLQTQWAKLFPEIPFQGGQQEAIWTQFFYSVDRSEQFNMVIASIAVLLACLGLYGLVTLNVSGRIREFSIRKTLGAGVKNITFIIVNQYVWLTAVALIIGAPVSYVFAKAYLDMLFAYPMPMTYTGVTISLLILVAVLLAVISTQIRKVLKTNPVNGLKVE